MTTLDELIQRVRVFSRDSGANYITDEMIMDWLNEAYTDLVARLKLFDEEVSTTTSGGNTLSFPTDEGLLQITSITLGTEDRAVPVDDASWESLTDQGDTPAQTVYRVYENQIEFYPTPASGTTVTLRYKSTPERLNSVTDSHELPAQLERKMLEYAKAQCRFADSDFDGGNNWLVLYEQSLPPLSSGRERFFTAPTFVFRRPDSFDLQGRHV